MSLWQKPIPVLGVTGEYSSGKTMFLATISPGPSTRIYDTEKSSESYAGDLGFDRIDLPAEMLRLFPSGYKPMDTFGWWVKHVKAIEPGRFKVIAIDVAEEIEAGGSDFVWENPVLFNRTRSQYQRMAGLYWADVKAMWKMILVDLASRCETFAFACHMGNVWAGERPTEKRKPKGKSTLMELASLYLEMRRDKDAAGAHPKTPSANVLKSRLSFTEVKPSGEVIILPALPARLPVATPAAIRTYLEAPRVGMLGEAELAPEHRMSEDERAQLRFATAQAEGEAERLRLERISEERKSAVQSPAAEPTAEAAEESDDGGQEQVESPKKRARKKKGDEQPAANGTNGDGTNGHTNGHAVDQAGAANQATINRDANIHGSIRMLVSQLAELLGTTAEAVGKSILEKYGVKSPDEFENYKLVEIEAMLSEKVRILRQEKAMAQPTPFG